MKWCHRVIHSTVPTALGGTEDVFAIHEVYSGQDDDLVGGPTESPVPVISDTVDGLRWTLSKMTECLDKPILEDDDSMVGQPM